MAKKKKKLKKPTGPVTRTAAEADALSRKNLAKAKSLTIKAPIKAEKEKKGIGKFREKKTLSGKVAKIATSTKTTGVLATIASTIVPAAKILKAPKAIKAAVGFSKGVPKTAAVARSRGLNVVSKLGQVGKSGRVDNLAKTFIDVDKIAKAEKLSRPQARALAVEIGKRRVRQIADSTVASRFASNAKSSGLTKSLLSKGGLSLSAASLFVGAVGSYPFAERNNDVEGMETALAEVEEILNAEETILGNTPYLNVLKQLRAFFEAARTKLGIDRTRLETLRGEQEAGETAFQAERRESDEAAQDRKREFAEEESERFEGIEEERQARAVREQELDIKKSRVFALRREGKFAEADELELEILNELKGGN